MNQNFQAPPDGKLTTEEITPPDVNIIKNDMCDAMSVVVIVAAPQAVPDVTLECLPDWTVGDLKKLIAEKHELHPKVEQQRLIYSGQLLVDEKKLSSELRHGEAGRHMLHLACTSLGGHANTGAHSSSSSAAGTPLSGALSSSGAEIPESPSFVEDVSSQIVIRNRFYGQAPSAGGDFAQQAYHNYYNQYYMAWAMQHHQAVASPDAMQQAVQQQMAVYHQFYHNQLAANHELMQRPVAQTPTPEQPQPVVREARPPIDWFEMISFIFKAAIYVCILGSYVSVERLGIMTLCLAVFYFFQCRRANINAAALPADPPLPGNNQEQVQNNLDAAPNNQEQAESNQEPAAPNNAAQAVLENQQQELVNLMDANNDGNNNVAEPNNNVAHLNNNNTPPADLAAAENTNRALVTAPETPSILSLSVTFVVSFFSSLFPERPEFV